MNEKKYEPKFSDTPPPNLPDSYPTWEEALDWSYQRGKESGMRIAVPVKKSSNQSSTIASAYGILAAWTPTAIEIGLMLFTGGEFVGWGPAISAIGTVLGVKGVISGRKKVGDIL